MSSARMITTFGFSGSLLSVHDDDNPPIREETERIRNNNEVFFMEFLGLSFDVFLFTVAPLPRFSEHQLLPAKHLQIP